MARFIIGMRSWGSHTPGQLLMLMPDTNTQAHTSDSQVQICFFALPLWLHVGQNCVRPVQQKWSQILLKWPGSHEYHFIHHIIWKAASSIASVLFCLFIWMMILPHWGLRSSGGFMLQQVLENRVYRSSWLKYWKAITIHTPQKYIMAILCQEAVQYKFTSPVFKTKNKLLIRNHVWLTTHVTLLIGHYRQIFRAGMHYSSLPGDLVPPRPHLCPSSAHGAAPSQDDVVWRVKGGPADFRATLISVARQAPSATCGSQEFSVS